MKSKNEKKRLFSHLPSWASSLIIAVLSYIILFFIAYTFGEILGYMTYSMVIVAACYFICREIPDSIWYTPLLCNIFGPLAAVGEENFYYPSVLFMVICSGWILSVISSQLGAKAGKRNQK